jgi:hypothetical protein
LIPFKEINRSISARLHGFLIMLTLFVTLFDTTPTSAARLRCASHRLVPAERDDVSERARRIVPRGGGALILESACLNRDFAIAWFRTRTVVDPDGMHWWWGVRCDRKTRSWSCDPAKRERRIEVSIADDAHPATVVASFPGGMSTSRVKAIVTATATLAMKREMPLSACSGGSDDASRWLRARSNPPSPDLNSPAAEVDVASTGAIVDYAQSLRFRFDKDDQLVCWDELLVVD